MKLNWKEAETMNEFHVIVFGFLYNVCFSIVFIEKNNKFHQPVLHVGSSSSNKRMNETLGFYKLMETIPFSLKKKWCHHCKKIKKTHVSLEIKHYVHSPMWQRNGVPQIANQIALWLIGKLNCSNYFADYFDWNLLRCCWEK